MHQLADLAVAASTSAVAPEPWLQPTQALSRFARPAAALATGSNRSTGEVARYGFVVGSFRFLIGRNVGSEVLDACPIAAVPRMPAWLAGVMNLRGNPVPVFDLAAALDVPADATARRKPVLVLGKGTETAGFLIDALPRAVPQERAIAVPTALPERLAPFVSAAVVGGDAVWLEFDHPGFLRALSGT